jgi:hypothetical protein
MARQVPALMGLDLLHVSLRRACLDGKLFPPGHRAGDLLDDLGGDAFREARGMSQGHQILAREAIELAVHAHLVRGHPAILRIVAIGEVIGRG